MKKNILLFIVLFGTINFNCICQERQPEARPKLELQMQKQTIRLSKITGWSRFENANGKFWKQSNLNSGGSYLPIDPELTFDHIQLFQFKLEGGLYYLFTIKYSDDSYRIFAFTGTSLKNLRRIIEKANGQSYYTLDIKDCEYLVNDRYAPKGGFRFDPEEIIKDKEMIRLLLTGRGESLNANFCKNDSILLINSQVLKSDTVVRFNLIPWNNDEIMPLTDNYFELKKSEFSKLFQFIPYIPYQNKK